MYFYRTRIVCHWKIYGYAPMIRSFVSCIVRTFHVLCVRSFSFFVRFISLVRSCIVRSFRVFVSCIVRFSYRSCETSVRFSCVSFAFFVRLCLVRIVNWYDPGSVYHSLSFGKFSCDLCTFWSFKVRNSAI